MTTPINTSLISFSDNVKPNVRNIIFNSLFYTQTSHRGNKPHVSGEIKENWKCNKNHFMIFEVAFFKVFCPFLLPSHMELFFLLLLLLSMQNVFTFFQFSSKLFLYIHYMEIPCERIFIANFFPLYTHTNTNQRMRNIRRKLFD